MKANLNLIKIDTRSLSGDALWLVISFIITHLIFFLANLVFNLFPFWGVFFKSVYSPVSTNFVKIGVWLLIFFFLKPYIYDFIKFIKRGKYYKYEIGDLSKKWIFHGGINENIERKELIIQDSYSGCLLNEKYWKNFEINFDLSLIGKDGIVGRIGILIYAENLENYYMLQLSNENEKLFIHPHVRVNGIFELLLEKIYTEINLDKFIKVKLNVNDAKINLFINDNHVFSWIAPTHFLGNHVPLHYREKFEVNKEDQTNNAELKNKKVPRIYNRNKYRMVGFRSDSGEISIIKNLEIKKI